MATKKDYFLFVMDQLHEFNNLTYKYMFGEYIISYKKNTLILTIDNECYVKINDITSKYLTEKVVPYPGFKEWYFLDIEDVNLVRDVIGELIKSYD